VSRQRYDPAEVVRRYVVEGEGVATIARALGTRPSYVLRLLMVQGVYERHRPSHSEWAREHAAGKVAVAEPESLIPLGVPPPAPMRTVPSPPERDPVATYIARLSPMQRPKHRPLLDTLALLLSDGRADAATLDWARLEPTHAVTARARLAERYAPTYANSFLSILRAVLRECLRLGLVDRATYQRVARVPSLPEHGQPNWRPSETPLRQTNVGLPGSRPSDDNPES
jgi:hypothetical protein